MGGLPDVREEIVASLRARIEAGTYFVSGDQIAEMMLRRLLADRVR
jgi:anti-sigma28 factor (negative regulator of flagellin synthesis)